MRIEDSAMQQNRSIKTIRVGVELNADMLLEFLNGDIVSVSA
jgi:hypothetical protein